MASKKRQQTINKRNRERAIEEKRTLKRQRRQEKREAIRNGEPWPPVTEAADPFAPPEDGEQPEAEAQPPADVG